MYKIDWTLAQLEIFVAAVEQGSFSAAGRKLGIAQSKVSNSVADLELILGLQLFSRAKKTPTPTPEGNKFYDNAKSILVKCERINTDMINISMGMENVLTIAIEDGLPFGNIDLIFKEIAAKFPSLSLTIINAPHKEIIQGVINRNIDLAVTLSPSMFSEFIEQRHLDHVKQILITSKNHPIAQLHSPSTRNLSEYREIKLITDMDENKYSSSCWYLTNYFNIAGVVSLGIGWALVPETVFNWTVNENDGLVSIKKDNYKTTLPLEMKLLKRVDHINGPVMRWLYEKFDAVFGGRDLN